MSEFDTGFAPEQENKVVFLTDEEKRLMLALAEIKRASFAIRIESKGIMLPDPTLAIKAKYERDLELVKIEADGDTSVELQEAQNFLRDEANQVREQAKTMSVVAPEYAGYLMAIVVKNEQAAGEEFSGSIAQSNEYFELGQRRAHVPSDLLGKAINLGVLTRDTQGHNLPAVESMLASALDDEELLRACALSLNDEDKATFVSLTPSEKREEVVAIFDHEQSKLLRHNLIEGPGVEDASQIRTRVDSKLAEIMGDVQHDTRLMKTLAETLCQLGGSEALGVLKTVARGGIEKSGERNAEKIAARIIHELLNQDELAGSQLAMSFVGKDGLSEHYFNYFINYLAEKGLLQKSFDQVEHWGEEKCQKLYEVLKGKIPEFADAQISEPFMNGTSIFGLQKMLHYAGRPDVGLHDAMFAFNKVIKLFESSGLSAPEFYGRVLNQIYLDGSTYQSGNSYQEFNEIVGSVNLSSSHLSAMKEKADKYHNIDKLHGLVELLTTPQDIFSSWNSLRKFSELSRLLERADILEQLSKLKTESVDDERKAQLYRYIETIAFHEDSRVDMQAVLQFWRNPEAFLEIDDDTLQTLEAHRSKKPSNYTEIPNLDLSAAELRDSLVSGELDRVQALKPMEITYSVEQGTTIQQELSFYQTVRLEIGSRKEGTANTKLFHELHRVMSDFGFGMSEFIDTQGECFERLPATEAEELKRQIKEATRQFPNEKLDREPKQVARRFRARVNYKSDPQAVLAGNDTACCMPFGSGKNNIYTFNPNCAMFTLEEAKGPDKWRTIAQSVLTLDKDIKRPIPEVIEELKKNKFNLSEVLPEDVVIQSDCFLACDNIEVAGNAMGSHKIIEAVYRDFFEKYVKSANRNSREVHISEDKVVIGQGYSDMRYGQKEENTYAPLAPVAYSDKAGLQVDVIRYNSGKDQSVVVQAESPEGEELEADTTETSQLKTGILPLTFTDTLSVAYIEGKAYKSNESLLAYLHNMENGLIAKDINNQHKSRPNLSLKYVDPAGKARGYLFAYEGKSERGEPMVFISDLASDLESQMAGGRLINGFVELYGAEYIAKGNMLPIYVEARESTSYPIIMGNVERISQRLGIKIQVDEVGTQSVGDDTMRELWLRPVPA